MYTWYCCDKSNAFFAGFLVINNRCVPENTFKAYISEFDSLKDHKFNIFQRKHSIFVVFGAVFLSVLCFKNLKTSSTKAYFGCCH